MEEAVTRLKLAADAGADVCFIEGVKTEELLRSTVAALAPKPVLVNVISGGLTPSFTCAEAEAMGAKIISEPIPCSAKVRSLKNFYSFLPRLLRGYGALRPRCYALAEEDRHRLHLCQGHGPQVILRSDGIEGSHRSRRTSRWFGIPSGLTAIYPPLPIFPPAQFFGGLVGFLTFELYT